MKQASSSLAPAGHNALQGAGLGLRRGLLDAFSEAMPATVDFLEVAPENWINVGGRYGKQFRELLQHYPLACHGLSLSIGGPAPLDHDFLQQLKRFLDGHNVVLYSEHLSYCSDDGHLYDLMPIPFTEAAVHYVADRIRQVQDVLERPLIIENVSYYAAPGQHMSESEFLQAVLEEADCQLLLDINNIYVNSINHSYDPQAFMDSVPGKRVAYFHVAGHYEEAPDLRVDTHGAPVIEPVWNLLERAYAQFGPVATLLERDFNIPPLNTLLQEVEHIHQLQTAHHAAPEVTGPQPGTTVSAYG